MSKPCEEVGTRINLPCYTIGDDKCYGHLCFDGSAWNSARPLDLLKECPYEDRVRASLKMRRG